MSNQHLGRKTAFRRRRILSGVAARSDASSEAILTPRDFCPIPTCRGKRCFLNKNMVGFATQAGPPSDGFPAGIIRICAVPRRRAGMPSSGLRRRLRQDRIQAQYDILYLLYIIIIVYPRFIISPPGKPQLRRPSVVKLVSKRPWWFLEETTKPCTGFGGVLPRIPQFFRREKSCQPSHVYHNARGKRRRRGSVRQEKITVKKTAYSPLFESNYARDTQVTANA